MVRQTQAEIQQKNKDNFLSDTKIKFDDLIAIYFLGQGYFLLAKDVQNSNHKIAEPIKVVIHEFIQARRLIDDGANLTEKRKVQMLEALYALEDVVSKTNIGHPILTLYRDLTKKRSQIFWLVAASVISLLIGLAFPQMLLGALLAAGYAGYFRAKTKSIKTEIRNGALGVISSI